MKEAFSGIGTIAYEGPKSKNALAFKHYNPEEVVAGKTMSEPLRFSVAYWHSFRNGCADQFGQPTRLLRGAHGLGAGQNRRVDQGGYQAQHDHITYAGSCWYSHCDCWQRR